jgi:hypothetical protein
MRRDTLKIAQKAPYGPHERLEGDKCGWNHDHRGEYDRFKCIGRTNTEVNSTLKAESKVFSDARRKVV